MGVERKWVDDTANNTYLTTTTYNTLIPSYLTVIVTAQYQPISLRFPLLEMNGDGRKSQLPRCWWDVIWFEGYTEVLAELWWVNVEDCMIAVVVAIAVVCCGSFVLLCFCSFVFSDFSFWLYKKSGEESREGQKLTLLALIYLFIYLLIHLFIFGHFTYPVFTLLTYILYLHTYHHQISLLYSPLSLIYQYSTVCFSILER